MEDHDPLWPDDFEDLEVEHCDAPLCDLPVFNAANVSLGIGPALCNGHYTKWCQDFDARPRHHIEYPKYLSFKVYFAKEVPLG